MVRLALVTSVTCLPPLGPPVRFQMHQVSMFPKSTSPFSALARAPSTLSRIHLILGPEKYVAIGRPVLARKRSWPPSADSALQIWSVRVSCQTMALWTGLPVAFSQTTVVSRWLVMPIAARSLAWMPAFLSAPSMTAWLRCQISIASCSTHPGFGKICSCSFWSMPFTCPA